MKKTALLMMFFLLSVSAFAHIDRYKTDKQDKSKTHITYLIPIYFSADHSNLMGTYTLTRNAYGKNSGSLSFEFKETANKLSSEIKYKLVDILKDLRESKDAHVEMTLTLKNKEQFVFNPYNLDEWDNEEWGQLLRLYYDKDNKQYSVLLMFPLDYMISNKEDAPTSQRACYKYILKALSKNNITRILITDKHKSTNISLDIQVDRPTAETIADMLKH